MITLYVLHAENYGNIFFKKMGSFLKNFLFTNALLKVHAVWMAIQNILIPLSASICIVMLDEMNYFSQIQIIFFTAANIFPFR